MLYALAFLVIFAGLVVRANILHKPVDGYTSQE